MDIKLIISNMLASILLPILTIIIMGIVIVIGPYIKKVTNCWYFWVVLGIGLLVYVIVCRFAEGWSDLNQYIKTGVSPDALDYDHDLTVSRGLLLDICPFTCLLLLSTLVFDPSRKSSQVVAPFAVFGGLITICSLNVAGDPEMSAQYIFVGIGLNNLYFMMHFIMVVIGTLVLVSTPRFKTYLFFKKQPVWQKLNISNVFLGAGYAALYYAYVGICMNVFKVNHNVSGLNLNDWSGGGEYGGVADTLNVSPAVAAALGFGASIISIILLIFGFSYLQQIRKYHWNNEFDKQSWYLWKTYKI